jgi:hypothetical protein
MIRLSLDPKTTFKKSLRLRGQEYASFRCCDTLSEVAIGLRQLRFPIGWQGESTISIPILLIFNG